MSAKFTKSSQSVSSDDVCSAQIVFEMVQSAVRILNTYTVSSRYLDFDYLE